MLGAFALMIASIGAAACSGAGQKPQAQAAQGAMPAQAPTIRSRCPLHVSVAIARGLRPPYGPDLSWKRGFPSVCQRDGRFITLN